MTESLRETAERQRWGRFVCHACGERFLIDGWHDSVEWPCCFECGRDLLELRKKEVIVFDDNMDLAPTPDAKPLFLRSTMRRLLGRLCDFERLKGSGRSSDSWRANYYAYQQSQCWQDLKSLAMWAAGNKCTSCGGTEGLELHHLHYRSLGKENPWTDVTIFCRQCHAKNHGVNQSSDESFPERLERVLSSIIKERTGAS
jgi:hypothetical protein